MSKETTDHASRILHSRYNHLLKQLRDFDRASDALFKKGFLSVCEKREIQTISTEMGKAEILCNFLTAKGASLLVNISEALTIEQKRQCGEEQCGEDLGSGTVVVTTSSSSSSSTETSVSSTASGGQDFEAGSGRRERSMRAGDVCYGQDDAKHFQGNIVYQ